MSDYFLKKVILILAAFSFCIMIVRLANGGMLDIPEDTRMQIEQDIQPLLELLLILAILISYIPSWVEKIKSTPIKKTIHLLTTIAIIAIIILLFPEFIDMPYNDQKLWMFIVISSVTVAYFVISYWWGKRHTKNTECKESEVEE